MLCEIAIAACDLAEVLGAAIALKLLFHIPLLAGVILTALDTVMVLWLSRYGIRVIEAMILSLIAVITGCFIVELFFAKPVMSDMISGLVPRLNDQSLYVAIAILGATVMPHNLYLHSALVQTRQIGRTFDDRRKACRFNFIDSFIALNGALIVNAAILIMAAAVFFKKAIVVTEIEQAHQLLEPLLGTTMASVLFAVALLASGQSSTLTGTFAGQIVMEGFLDLRVRPWLRRLITRTLAMIPAVFTIWIAGERGTYKLLLLSQVILSMQLPFAVIPLIRFTSDQGRMGEFANRVWVKVLAWACAILIVVAEFLAGAAGRYPLGTGRSLASVADCAAGVLRSGASWLREFHPAAPKDADDFRSDHLGNRHTGLPPDPGASGPLRSRSGRAGACRRHGQSIPCHAAPAARGRRRHQPVVRAHGVGSRGAVG